MKKLFLIICVGLLFNAVIETKKTSAQETSNTQNSYSTIQDGQDVKRLNARVVELYRANKVDEAMPIANRVLTFLKENQYPNTFFVEPLTNLGFLHRKKADLLSGQNSQDANTQSNSEEAQKYYKEAMSFFKQALQAQLKVETDSLPETVLRTEIAKLLVKESDYASAEIELKKALKIREIKLGKHSSVINLLRELADLYKKKGSGKEALNCYKEALEVGEEIYFDDETPLIPLLESYAEFLLKNNSQSSQAKELLDRVKSISEITQSGKKAILVGIVNGKAIDLKKPRYPLTTSAFKGEYVEVRVVIDENGKVVKAKAVSGTDEFRKATEEAAKKSTFNPTVVDGKPVRVIGIIRYTFIMIKRI